MHPGKAEITFLSKLLPASASLPLSASLHPSGQSQNRLSFCFDGRLNDFVAKG